MRYLSTLLFLVLGIFISNQVLAQTETINEDFSDGDFTNNPSWSGDDARYTIASEESNYLLQLQDTDYNSPSYLSTVSTAAYGSWEFYFRYDGSTAPSGSNKAEIFLLSDITNLEGPVNGYAVQVGESGDDFFNIIRYDNGAEEETILSDTTLIENNDTGYRVRVSRDLNGEWNIEVGKGSSGQLYDSGNTAVDNTYQSSEYFGFLTTYTSGRSENFFYDDIKVSKITPPFDLQNISVEDNQSFELTFNQDIDESSIQDTDFSINGIGNPNSPNVNGQVVTFSYDTPLDGGNYTLSISDEIKSESGNSLAEPKTHSFTLFDDFEQGDIIISEFMYDPPPADFNFDDEYVEIRNTTDKIFNLQNWLLGNDSSFEEITGDTLTLRANEYLVISADSTALKQIFDEQYYFEPDNFPGLVNSGDAVRLQTNTGILADSLTYTPDWGGEDVALERRSTSAPSTLPENWGDSPNLDGGTPGAPNEVETDDTPPFIDDIQIVDATNIRIIFSESIISSSASDKLNYEITTPSTSIDVQTVAVGDNLVNLTLAEELVSEQAYTIEVSNISDIFGNTISTIEDEVTYLRIDDVQQGDIVINEIMYDPGGDEADFVELYNASSKNFDLSNWQIGDAVGNATIPGNTQLLAGEYLVLTGSDIFANSINNAIDVSGFPAYNSNTPDAVFLKTNEGQTIDSLRYSQTWGGSDGSSLERKDPQGASNDASNWQTSTADNGYSAGLQNAGFKEDTNPPEIIFSKVESGGTVEVRFNEFIRLTDEVEFLMDGQKLNILNFDSANANIVTLESPSNKSSKANSSTITAHNLSDVKGNSTASTEVAVAQPLQPADLVINEIMFNPLSDPDDNQPDQGEYIELRNTQDYAISLEGLFLHDEPDENGEVRDLQPVSSTAKWVPAQGQVLVHADPAQTFEDSRVAEFFEINTPNLRSMMRIDRTTLSLASNDDAIYIADSTGATIDSVFYNEEWHNPNIIDTRGVALERITPGGPSDDDSNWGSSVNEKGGTPNSENSIYQENADGPQETGISFTPNPFSPDDDGYEDNLFINYKLDQQDYLIDVRVYDRYGRLVRELADGKQAGFEGQLIWDGRKDDNSRNRIGIYIVVFEAYDSASGGDQSFKKTAVLARRLN